MSIPCEINKYIPLDPMKSWLRLERRGCALRPTLARGAQIYAAIIQPESGHVLLAAPDASSPPISVQPPAETLGISEAYKIVSSHTIVVLVVDDLNSLELIR